LRWKNALAYYASIEEKILVREEDEELLGDLRNGVLIASAAIAESSN
jgi:hypothetical protein